MKRFLLPVLAAALSVTACGGSGGGITTTVTPDPSLSIDAANGQEAVRVSYLAAVASGETAGLVGNSGLVADSGGGGVSKTRPQPGLSKAVSAAVSGVPRVQRRTVRV